MKWGVLATASSGQVLTGYTGLLFWSEEPSAGAHQFAQTCSMYIRAADPLWMLPKKVLDAQAPARGGDSDGVVDSVRCV